MKDITRSIPVSTVKAAVVTYENGKLETKDLAPVIITGEEITKEKAMKVISKEFGKDATYIVKDVIVETAVYSITLEEFMKAAKKIEPTKAADKPDHPTAK
jgi:hypothetical protein